MHVKRKVGSKVFRAFLRFLGTRFRLESGKRGRGTTTNHYKKTDENEVFQRQATWPKNSKSVFSSPKYLLVSTKNHDPTGRACTVLFLFYQPIRFKEKSRPATKLRMVASNVAEWHLTGAILGTGESVRTSTKEPGYNLTDSRWRQWRLKRKFLRFLKAQAKNGKWVTYCRILDRGMKRFISQGFVFVLRATCKRTVLPTARCM